MKQMNVSIELFDIMRPIYLSILLFTLINIASIHQQEVMDYCCLRCGKKHVMCKYPKDGPGKHCRGLKRPKLTPAQVNDTLYHLNVVKNKAALGKFDKLHAYGLSFRRLEWDEELENMAIRWAQQCAPAGTRDKCRDTMRFDADQILHSVGAGGKYKDILRSAFRHQKCFFDRHEYTGEIRNYCLPNLIFPGKNVKSFARLIRYENYKVGCAFQQTTTQTQLICNIGPGLLQPIEQLGRWSSHIEDLCSDCPNNTKCLPPFRGLCAYADKAEISSEGSTLTSFISNNVINCLCWILMSFFTF